MDQIEQVRLKTDIVELISSYISLKKAGRNFKALCPFHGEKTPSFVVSPERQIYKCFGCGQGGNVFNFLMEYEKMGFGEALRLLADKAGIKLVRFKPSPAQQQREKLLSINHLASEFYHYILLNHRVGKKGLDYLLKRGINKSSIKLFKLGYAPDDWQSLKNVLVKKGFKTDGLEKAGLIISGRGFYDRFRGRIIFPLTDQRNNILGFSARTLKPDLKGAKYINSPETSLYHKGELLYGLNQAKEFIKKKNKAVIVEGEFDVISSYQSGAKNVVAIKGSALTEDQVNLIKRYCQTIILALDADMAGDSAVRKGIETADSAGLVIRVTQPEYGKDPDECAQHSALMWRNSVKRAIPIYDFYLKSAKKRFNQKEAEGKKYISEELLPILAKISNEVVKAHYFKKLAELLKVDEETIVKEGERQLKLVQKPMTVKSSAVISNNLPAKTRKEKMEEFLLSLLLQQKDKAADLIKDIDLQLFNHPAIKKIIKALKEFLGKNKLDINKFAKTIPTELIETTDRLYLEDLQDILKDDNNFLREFNKTKNEIEKIYLKQETTKLTEEIKNKEKQKDYQSLKKLRQEFDQLLAKLKSLS